jgi:hypothetical protein
MVGAHDIDSTRLDSIGLDSSSHCGGVCAHLGHERHVDERDLLATRLVFGGPVGKPVLALPPASAAGLCANERAGEWEGETRGEGEDESDRDGETKIRKQ